VGDLSVQRYCQLIGDLTPLARLRDGQPLLAQVIQNQGGLCAFLAATPGSSSSSLARDGIVWYAMLQRALQQGSGSLGLAQQREAGSRVLKQTEAWKRADGAEAQPALLAVTAASLTLGDKSMALNRPIREDSTAILSEAALEELFAGLQFHRVDDSVENKKDLANEIWRTFLLLMAVALIGEAILCLPTRKAATAQ
jgi:hypothetical protein